MTATISARNQKKLDWAHSKGLVTDELIKNYGIRFTIKLLKSVTQKRNGRKLYTRLLSPPIPYSEFLSFDTNDYLFILLKVGLHVLKVKQDELNKKGKFNTPKWDVLMIK